MHNNGVLYVVATPIGNLEDITLRALRILKEVNCILCEDTRVTIRLLNKYEIKSKLISLHKYNEEKSIQGVLNLLKEGKNIALVSDAGTPLISDPGSRLIVGLRKNNIKIIPIPGPSALSSSLSICGFDLKEVLFLGFLPHRKSKRIKIISSLKEKSKVVVMFVAPHDFKKYIFEISSYYPEIEVFYSKEISKIYEENWSGNIKDLVSQLETKSLKGEFVLVLNFNSICD